MSTGKMQTFKPYCYLIGWSTLNLWYYGSEYANSSKKMANPSNLWTIYFTSSKIVRQMREYCGEPDIVRISKKQFVGVKDTKQHESNFLKRVKAVRDSRWLNRSNGEAHIGDNKGRKFTDAHKEKLRQAKLGRKHTEEHNKKIGEKSKGRIFTEEHNRRLTESLRGKKRTPEQNQASSIRNKGKSWTEARRQAQLLEKE